MQSYIPGVHKSTVSDLRGDRIAYGGAPDVGEPLVWNLLHVSPLETGI
jgi:hypothetical protein